ncbi:MAG: group II intron reverse transcriptase/maturase [Candidatus Thiodiazotropha sp.]
MKRVVIRMTRQDSASEKQLRLPPARGDEILPGETKEDAPVINVPLMERVLDRANLFVALKRVTQNKGSAGIDGMRLDELPMYLKAHWPRIRQELLEGRYKPQPVKRVSIPKPGGGERHLGIPTVLDRLIQQALLQVIQPEWDRSFSHSSYGFRPGRSAHQAIAQAQSLIKGGNRWVVDMDIEKFFDRVNHDKLMHRVKQRIEDRRVLKLINGYLKAGVMIGVQEEPSQEGTPQGGPLSPLLANLLLDDLDKELERRGHRFIRYADDCNIYVRSRRAGERVLESLTCFLERKLKLSVNQSKSAVDRPWRRSFLGITFSYRGGIRTKVSTKAEKALKEKIRRLTRRTRGHSLRQVIAELRKYLLGWKAYYGICEVKRPFVELDKWIRRRLRSYAWKQWGRSGYRQLRKLGIDVRLAWNTAKSAHGPWRLSKSPALNYGMPTAYFVGMGLPLLREGK